MPTPEPEARETPEVIYDEIPDNPNTGDQYVPMASVSLAVNVGTITAIVIKVVKTALQESHPQPTPSLPTVQNMVTPGEAVNRPGTPQVIPEEDIPYGWSEEDEINAILCLPPQPQLHCND